MNQAITKTKNIAKDFAIASKNKDVVYFQDRLADNGTFDIQTDDLETQEVGKQEFIKWYSEKIEETEITKIDFDQCLHCFIGNQVVLFNEGSFPRKIKDSSERSKTGIMLDIKDEMISTLKFCYLFAITENKYVFECRIEKIKEYQSQGMSWDDAFNKTIEFDGKIGT